MRDDETPGLMALDKFLARVDSKPYLEYIDGAVLPKSGFYRNEGKLVADLGARLWTYENEHGGDAAIVPHINFSGEGHVVYRIADVAYWAPGTLRVDSNDICFAPTIAVDIRTGDYTLEEHREKCRYMASHGVQACWLIAVEGRTVEVLEGGTETTLSGGAALTSPHLPGFSLALPDLFAVLDR
jgi:hypothetical protein